MKKLHLMLVLFFSITLCISHTFAQYEPSTQIGLPDGTIARFGKGSIRGIAYSPDGTQIAVTTSIGVWLYDAQTGKELDLITGKNRGGSSTIVFSPDHKKTVTFNWWGTKVQLWNAQTGKQIKTLTGHKGEINGIVFSPNSKTIATASDDKTIRLWNARTGKNLKILTGHTELVNIIEFSPDGKIIASGSKDKTIKLWNVQTGKLIHTFTELQRPFAFSQDGKSLIGINETKSNTQGVKRLVQMWDTSTGQLIKTLSWNNIVYSLSYSPDGNKIAAGGYDGTIRLWDATTGESIKTFRTHTEAVYIVQFSPDGNKIATASWDNTMQWWDINTTENLKTFSGYKGGQPRMQYSPDGKILAINWHTEVWLQEAFTGRQLTTLKGHKEYVTCIAFSQDGNLIATGSKDKTVRLWHTKTGENTITLTGHEERVFAAVFSSDGKTIVTASSDETVRLWDAHTGDHLRTIKGDTFGLKGFRFVADGESLFTNCTDKTVRVWNTTTGENTIILKGDTYDIRYGVLSPDSKIVATSCDDFTVRLWNLNTGENTNILRTSTATTSAVEFSPDGKTLAIATPWDNTPWLWDVATGQHLKTFEPHGEGISKSIDRFFAKFWGSKKHEVPDDYIRSIQYSPSGDMIAAFKENNIVLLWNVTTGKLIGKPIGPLKEDPSFFRISIVFSPDGKTFATKPVGNFGGTVRLWDSNTGKHLKTLSGNTYCVGTLRYSPDSKTIATGHWDGTVLLWDIPAP